MAFVKKTWRDRLSEFPGRRKLKDVNTEMESVCDVTRAEGELFQSGDAYNAENMNDLEGRIEVAFDECVTSGDVKYIRKVTALPSDAANHTDTFYAVIG